MNDNSDIFYRLNGLYIFTPDTINRVLIDESEEESTICTLIQQNDDQVKTVNSLLKETEILK